MASDMTQEMQQLSLRFRHFALRHRKPPVTLYSDIASGIADDPEVLALAQHARSRPVPQLLLAAVHFLLLRGVDHPLRSFFSDLNGGKAPMGEVYPAFQSFCRKHREQILELIGVRRTQTNEVGRCIYLALGIYLVAREVPRFALVDVGCSAGLHLLWKKYGYNYEGRRLGDAGSGVELECHFEGTLRPALPDVWPEPVAQAGIDLEPLRVENEDDCLWLESLIWPEFSGRVQLLKQALRLARQHPPHILAGDACEILPDLAEKFPRDAAIVVCHCHVLNQFASAQRERFNSILNELGRSRNVYRLSAEWINTQSPELIAYHYHHGRKLQRLLANVNDSSVQWLDRGDWIEALDPLLAVPGLPRAAGISGPITAG